MSQSKVLITEEIAPEGIEALRARGYQVDVMADLAPDQLREVIEPYDALIVRSGTVVDAALLDAAVNLKIIGRAGVTVDNIDFGGRIRAGHAPGCGTSYSAGQCLDACGQVGSP